jgi:sensor histidine kinase YesM
MNFKSPLVRESVKVFLICLAAAAATTYLTCQGCQYNSYLAVLGFATAMWFVLWMGNGLLAEYVGSKISWVDNPVKRLLVGIITTFIYTILSVSFLIWIFELLLNFNFGDHLTIILIAVIITFTISTVLHSQAFLMHWKESAINAEKFEKESIKAQYESLKNQVNPHFLFNSLNALTNLVYEDQDRAAKFIKQLSDVYRYVLDTREKEVVSLAEELEFLESYLYLQEIRFGKNLIIDISLKNTVGNIAPLAMQLLVENAIKHNVISRDEPLTIRIYEKDGYLVVENNLQKRINPEENLSGLGLQNIQKRYSFLTSKKVVIDEGSGTFIVRLPVINLIAA